MSLLSAVKTKIRKIDYDRKRPMICKWSTEKRAETIMRRYKEAMGYEFNLNAPKTFTEKVQWYEIYYDKPELNRVVDKYLFKGYIEEKLGKGHTIPLYGAWSNIRAFKRDWGKLPNQFVLKSTIQSDGRYIKVVRDKSKLDYNELIQLMEKWLNPRNTLINSLCRAYYRTKPRILAEQYMEGVDGQLDDYKLFCFDGHPFCFYVAKEYKVGTDSPIVFYDLEWNKLDVQYGNHRNDVSIEKPQHLSKMIEWAKTLSKGFPFVRVDFFNLPDTLYLAELTLYPGGGKTPYHPESFNKELGDLFILPEERNGR